MNKKKESKASNWFKTIFCPVSFLIVFWGGYLMLKEINTLSASKPIYYILIMTWAILVMTLVEKVPIIYEGYDDE